MNQFSVEGAVHIYRAPFFEGGKWRCRRRNKSTGKVSRLTLRANGVRDARRAIAELALAEDNQHLRGHDGNPA